MKSYFLLLIAACLIFVSCDLTDPLKDKLNSLDNGFDQEISYTLTKSDYTTLQNRIIYLDSNNVATANFIASQNYFTNETPGSKYIPMLLDVLMPNLKGSKAYVTFNYNGSAPDDLVKIAGMNSYLLSHTDYLSIDSTAGYLNYFAPPYIPAKYIPNILKHNVKYEGNSDTVVVKYQYSANSVKVDFKKQINAQLSESFNNGDLGLFTKVDLKGNQSWNYANKDDGAASINGYDDVYFDNEDWLVSPTIDLTDVTNTYLQIKHNVRYYETGCLSLMVTTDVDSTVKAARWSQYAISDPKTEVSVFVYSELFNLSSYDGAKIRVAFKYISSASSSKAPEWSISEIEVGNYGYKVIGGGDTYLVQDYYAFDSLTSKWTLIDNIHRLNNADYKALDLSETAFSQTLPSQDYLPLLANKLFTTAATDDVVYFVYDYNNGEKITLADKLTKSGSEWVSTYSYIQKVTQPFGNTNGVWKFDPTVYLSMEKSDYQIIVDYSNNNGLSTTTAHPENTENYFGTSSYYPDFDVRVGSYSTDFSTWQDAVVTSLLEGFLPNKYPEAQKFISGVEAFYYITFKVYSGATVSYTCKFGVSKDAPSPEFYLINGPTKDE